MVLTTLVVVGLGLVALGVPGTVALLLAAIATATAPAATIAAQAVRLDHAYEFMDYDLASGSGGVNPEVEFFIYNP